MSEFPESNVPEANFFNAFHNCKLKLPELNETEADFTNALRNCDFVEFPELNVPETDFTNAFHNCVLKLPDCDIYKITKGECYVRISCFSVFA
jgi:hypothetical protein